MVDSAIVFTYSRAVPGREVQAFEAFTEAMAFFGTKAHEGICEDPINFMGTGGQSFFIVPGEYRALYDLMYTDEFLDLYTRALYAVPDIGYEIGAFGPGVQDWMARWNRVGSELALL